MTEVLGARPAAPLGVPKELRTQIDREIARNERRRRQVLFGRIGLLIGIVAAWEIFSGTPGEPGVLIDKFYISQPSDVLAAIWNWIETGVLLTNLWATTQVTIIGFFAGALLGLLVGFALGVNAFLSAIFSPIVAALYAIPRLALIPLFLLWFGLGIGSKLALVITVVFFLVFYNTHEGVRDVDRGLIDVMRVMKASRLQIYRTVTLPSAMTWIIAGLRISVPYALVGAVTGEMMASNSGMGYLIIRASGQFYTAGVFGGILIIMIFALVLGAFVTLAERRLLRWKPDRLLQGS